MKKLFLIFVLSLFQASSGWCVDWKGLHEQADKTGLSEALEGVRQKPDSFEDRYILGLAYLNLHKDREAGEVFQALLSQGPDSPEAKWGVAEVLRRGHEPGRSEELLKEVLKASPDFPPAMITLAYIRYIQLKFDEAVRLALKVEKQGREKVDLSNYVRAILVVAGSKGMIAQNGGPLSKAINGTAVLPNLWRAEKLQPDSAGVRFGLGSFYFLAPAVVGGSKAKAETFLKKTIELDPFFVDAYVRLAQLYSIKKDMKKYKEYLQKAEAVDPRNEILVDFKSGACKFICSGGE
jgi:tetratricopeptide (TPR) repeat protein